jgi:hypothetical protein
MIESGNFLFVLRRNSMAFFLISSVKGMISRLSQNNLIFTSCSSLIRGKDNISISVMTLIICSVSVSARLKDSNEAVPKPSERGKVFPLASVYALRYPLQRGQNHAVHGFVPAEGVAEGGSSFELGPERGGDAANCRSPFFWVF